MAGMIQTMAASARGAVVPIHRAGWPFVAGFAIASVLLALLWPPLGWLGLVATGWCLYFFRDPPRVTPTRGGLVISPADGVVQDIVMAPPPPELGLGEAPLTRVSVFLNVFDVHVNRVPADGVVERAERRPGSFLNAGLEAASERNERASALLRLSDGRALAFAQIAGLVARRIICELRPGQTVVAGERFGLIRFGSRADLYLPDGVAPLVAAGQRAVAGETVIADLRAEEPARQGAVR